LSPALDQVEVFADVRCPFTHYGLRRFVEERERIGARCALRVRAWPLELVNGAPLDVDVIAEEVDVLRESVAPDLFAGFDRARFPPTSVPALEFAATAYERDLATGERTSLLLRDALFEDARDISQPEELDRIARSEGLPYAGSVSGKILEDWREGRRRGVVGSPHFFVGEDDFFCPSLRIDKAGEEWHISSRSDELARFIAHCVER
jgi:2-hydroxychromene-2-carboxylate isomerase